MQRRKTAPKSFRLTPKGLTVYSSDFIFVTDEWKEYSPAVNEGPYFVGFLVGRLNILDAASVSSWHIVKL